ncbi:MAG: HD domain-containing protein [Spirochaetales bacterium]|nr:HD domain-containing protein [Spirochaetales bacterium]MBP7262785.1 HD domain-containing protein [Spirochaetia bacterium]
MASQHGSAQRILRIDSELNQIRDFDLLLDRVLLEARRVVNADAGSIYVKDGNVINIKFAHNDTKQRLLPPGEKQPYPHFSIPVDESSISGYAAMTGELVNIKNVYRIPRGAPYSFNTAYDQKSGYRTQSMLTVPLKAQNNRVLGVIQIINALDEDGKVRSFTKRDEALVTHFSEDVTVALERAHMTRLMIMRMIRMAEMRDPKETGAHVNRVAGYSVELYERWAYKHGLDTGLVEKQKDVLKIAAMLHDVGKVAISDTILKKPARFTQEEYVIMQSHTCAGSRLFDDPQSEFDTVAAEVALTHHESWDGSGYPGWIDPVSGAVQKPAPDGTALRRRGTEIPVWGRIVALADVYDALMSRRVYKEPWDEDAVLKEIRSLSGTKFDPEFVDIFFEVLPRLREIRERHPDLD